LSATHPLAKPLAGFMVGAAGMFATMYSTQAILPELSRDFGVSPSRAGLSISVVVLAVAVGGWGWGPVSDRIGRPRSFRLASVLLVLPTLGVALAPGFETLLVFRTLQGLCMPGLLAVGAPYVVEAFVPRIGARAMGYYVSALVAGGLVGRLGVALASSVIGWRAAIGALVVAGSLVAYVRAHPASAAPLAPVGVPSSIAESPPGDIVVHVVGAVRKPGVYTFTQGARVVDAVRAAGGFTSAADQQAINLARPLVDGEQIVVPRHGEAPASGAPATAAGGGVSSGGKVNINSASAGELEQLPGIGPVLAQRIVEYRTQHGPFRTVKDLTKVPGIGEKKFSSLEPYVTV